MLNRTKNLLAATILLLVPGIEAYCRIYSTPQWVCAVTGSTVEIPCKCSYHSNRRREWYRGQSWKIEVHDLSKAPEYSGRVSVNTVGSHCDLTMKNVSVSDSGVYNFRFKTHRDEWTTAPPGVNLTVRDLQVKVEPYYEKKVQLICSSTCNLNKYYFHWYRNGVFEKITNLPLIVSNYIHPSEVVMYACKVYGSSHYSPQVYSPRDTRAVVVPSGNAVEGYSVTLSCSSDANPPVLTYSWFKQTAAVDTLVIQEQNYSISNIRPQHSGFYYCTAHNLLGQNKSNRTVLDSPKNTRAVVVPSGDTMEGDSVTLSCSSDANPAVVTYSWFQQRASADTLLIPEQNYSISNISSQHSGLYYCTAHNRLGHNNSTLIHLDVFYPPRNRSVTLISSVSGDSITLSCDSQSNPSSSYTWYWRSEGDVRLVGNSSNVTFSSRENGFYFCSARNRFGSLNSSEWENTADSRAVKYAGFGVTGALFMILIAIFLGMRYPKWRKVLPYSNSGEECSKNDSAPVYGNISAMNADPSQRPSSEDQDDVQYTSVYFRHSRIQDVPLYSTVQLRQDLKREEEAEYARVNIVKSRVIR